MSVKWKYFLSVLFLAVNVIWLAVLAYPKEKLQLISCDVGQGDATLAVFGDIQILVDGGPDDRILECLAKYVPFWDRTIEAVVMTHPQKDHFGGLIDVFKSYQVETFFGPGISSSSQAYQVLESQVGGSGAEVLNATGGVVIRLGLIHLDILHPSKEYLLANSTSTNMGDGGGVLGAYTTTKDPNEFSVVAILRYKKFDALLTGDIGPKISNLLIDKYSEDIGKEVEYIKIPHHGSKNGVTKELLDAVEPEIGVISVGVKNRYGHPHKEVIKLLKDRGIEIFRTDEMGDIEVVTDGDSWQVLE